MPEELTSKQEATSPTSAGVLKSTCIFKWVPEFNLWTCLATTAEGNSCWASFVTKLPCLCAAGTKGQGWEQLCLCWASFGGFVSLNSCTPEPWFHPHKRERMFLFYQNTVLLHLFLLFPVPNRSICCSSTAPGTQPLIPPWSVQKSWKSKRSAFTPATSKRSSRLGSASGTEALLWWSSCVQSAVPTLPFPSC